MVSETFPYLVDLDVLAAFERDGFVVTPDALSATELDRFGPLVDAEVARRTAHDVRDVKDKSTYEQSFIQCMRLWETEARLKPLSCHHGLAGIATQLLGVNGVRMWQDQALYKESGGRETTPHQDQTFWPLGEEPLLSAWIPFDDIKIDNGAMAYVPGSHKAGRLRVVDITHTTEPYEILKDPALGGAQPQWVEVKAGSVVWHHGMTVHMAAANTSGLTRRVFTVVYIGDEARRVRQWPVFPLDRAGVKVGEVARGPGMPRLWPPGEDWPATPEQIGGTTGPQ